MERNRHTLSKCLTYSGETDERGGGGPDKVHQNPLLAESKGWRIFRETESRATGRGKKPEGEEQSPNGPSRGLGGTRRHLKGLGRTKILWRGAGNRRLRVKRRKGNRRQFAMRGLEGKPRRIN